ncbi:MAG: hypothetical protein ACYTG6_03685 [Planctomycetota bacterium]
MRFRHSACGTAVLCALMCLGAGSTKADTASETYLQLAASISGPVTAAPDEVVPVEIYGSRLSGGPLSWTLWLDATWSYDPDHRAEPVGGTLLASSPPFIWNMFQLTLPLGPLPPGEHTLTLVVEREFAVGHYNVAVDLAVTVGNVAVPVAVDVLPGACPNPYPLRSRGMLPVAVLGGPDIDVRAIDPSSVRLHGVAPVRWRFDDVSGPASPADGPDACPLGVADGAEDLLLMFDRRELSPALGEAARGDLMVLDLAAETLDGVPLEGADRIMLR